MGGTPLKFKKNPRYTHHRSEGLTHRGADRQERLMRGPKWPTSTSTSPAPSVNASIAQTKV